MADPPAREGRTIVFFAPTRFAASTIQSGRNQWVVYDEIESKLADCSNPGAGVIFAPEEKVAKHIDCGTPGQGPAQAHRVHAGARKERACRPVEFEP